MGVFDQYNQAKLGPENDYQAALGMLGKPSGGSPQWASYDSGQSGGINQKDVANFAKSLYGSGGDQSGEKLSLSPEASGGQPSTPGNIPAGPAPNVPAYDMPMSPASAMGAVKTSPAGPVTFPSYDSGGGSGSGGGMDMGSMASIASSFM